MEITHLHARNFKPHKWSGGTTTELFIFPEGANYKDLNFDFRLSTATVEVDASVFTPLTGVSRTLMVLNGEMSLNHNGHHSSKLGKFDVDQFKGDWLTASKGECTDFNLMTMGQTKGGQEGILIEEGETIDYPIGDSWSKLFFYFHSGSAQIEIGGNLHVLEQGDLFVIQNPKQPSLKIGGKRNCEVAFCWIEKDS